MPREPRNPRTDPQRDPAWLYDMVVAAEKVRSFVAGRTFEECLADEMLRSAVERQVEIIGEAARRLTKAFRDAHPQIPWNPIMAQRHRLAHDYDEIMDEVIWKVATVHVPEWIVLVKPLIPPTPPEGSA